MLLCIGFFISFAISPEQLRCYHHITFNIKPFIVLRFLVNTCILEVFVVSLRYQKENENMKKK